MPCCTPGCCQSPSVRGVRTPCGDHLGVPITNTVGGGEGPQGPCHRQGREGGDGRGVPRAPHHRQGGRQALPKGLLQELQLARALQDQHGPVAVGQGVTPRIRGAGGDTEGPGAVGCWWLWGRVFWSSTRPQAAAGRAGLAPCPGSDGMDPARCPHMRPPPPTPPRAGDTHWPVTAGGGPGTHRCHRLPHRSGDLLVVIPHPTVARRPATPGLLRVSAGAGRRWGRGQRWGPHPGVLCPSYWRVSRQDHAAPDVPGPPAAPGGGPAEEPAPHPAGNGDPAVTPALCHDGDPSVTSSP